MKSDFKNIKVLIWDFDGTLYKPNPLLWQAVREAEYNVIMSHTGWSRDKTEEEFIKLHKKVLHSATHVVSALSHLPIKQAALEMEEKFDRRDFVQRDDKLIDLFSKLTSYRHIIFGNGVERRHRETLDVLGIPQQTFELFVTGETVGATKPDEKGFRYILEYTNIPASQHLMIGDREPVDLLPAKRLGMHTLLVWSDTRGTVADITLKEVYNLALYL